MSLLRLDIHQLRNLQASSLRTDPHINLIVGPNASGKTSLLEAIYLLGRGRSFRTPRSADLIAHGADRFSVAGRIFREEREISLGVGFAEGERRLKLDGRIVDARAELLHALPVQFIDPTLHTLLGDAPKARRQFLDWGTFYAETDYLPAWRRYRRALEQRNAVLKSGRREAAILWGRELVKYGKIIEICRRRYVEALQIRFKQVAEQAELGTELELRYLPGWAGGKSLEAALHDDLDRDIRHGCTHSGPHRDDFTLYDAGRPVRRRLSRGQMKLLTCVLALVQTCLPARPVCLLIDDLASELDLENQALLTDLIVHFNIQIFITATHPEALPRLGPRAGRTFRLERGVITPN
ncbi:MAG: DNA replication/repair protein RecF [Methylohalobius crimeensis]